MRNRDRFLCGVCGEPTTTRAAGSVAGVRLDEATCRERFEGARSGQLATVGLNAWPHIVPVTFAVLGDAVAIGIDQKPKTTSTNLRRLRNIAENDRVALLCDRYSDDWGQLWWVRADGHAALLAEGPDRDRAVDALVTRYSQYASDPPRGPVIWVSVARWSGWSYAPAR